MTLFQTKRKGEKRRSVEKREEREEDVDVKRKWGRRRLWWRSPFFRESIYK